MVLPDPHGQLRSRPATPHAITVDVLEQASSAGRLALSAMAAVRTHCLRRCAEVCVTLPR